MEQYLYISSSALPDSQMHPRAGYLRSPACFPWTSEIMFCKEGPDCSADGSRCFGRKEIPITYQASRCQERCYGLYYLFILISTRSRIVQFVHQWTGLKAELDFKQKSLIPRARLYTSCHPGSILSYSSLLKLWALNLEAETSWLFLFFSSPTLVLRTILGLEQIFQKCLFMEHFLCAKKCFMYTIALYLPITLWYSLS